ncbi:hypothetical protein KGQ19_32085 [Catenulispora sp. NL8]|uniref:Uncharacterized protein n=1 Tax=Catenulispora pinistramenti TaxID=2705254 RepID=A0ABS5KZK8_9ACTN|nr:hypothetical protein [Catenulispora pinistramenti]MBS2551518.1 hypothetical protein [Catenulispora pinistramenti]
MSRIKLALARPFMTPDTRLLLRHQRLDAEAGKRAGWALQIPDVEVRLVTAVNKRGPDLGKWLVPQSKGKRGVRYTGDTAIGRWYRHGAMKWDHQRVTIAGSNGTGVWLPETGGLLPGFDAVEVFQAHRRPTGSGECRSRIAAIATVGLAGRALQRIVFLDAEARELGWIPAPYFAEDDVMKFAQAAGIAYRRYAFTLARFSSARVSPTQLCEALFTRSALRVKLMSEEFSTNDWLTDPTQASRYR